MDAVPEPLDHDAGAEFEVFDGHQGRRGDELGRGRARILLCERLCGSQRAHCPALLHRETLDGFDQFADDRLDGNAFRFGA